MLKKILLLVLLLLAGFLGFVAFQPAEFTITRDAVIAAPPAAVFAEVNELRRWQAWSPWAKLDPQATNTYSGPESGEGAAMTWSGNDQMGEGTMTITGIRPGEHLAMRLDFRRPMAATNTTAFTFAPEGQGTRVTWSMSGRNGFAGKAMFLLFRVRPTLEAQFDEGLANLAAAVAAAGKTPAP